jgi:uncharacterized repeat protein (TIGR03803 family)
MDAWPLFMRTQVLCGIALVAFIGTVVIAGCDDASAKSLKTIYSFCSSGCGDGQEPVGRLVTDDAGNLYGVTDAGGAQGLGAVFMLVPNARRTKWKERLIYSFCAAGDCSAGQTPRNGLIIDASGNLYGVSSAGPSTSGGAVFELKPNKKKTKWALKVLQTFCSDWPNCTGGKTPASALTYAGAQSGAPYDGEKSPLWLNERRRRSRARNRLPTCIEPWDLDTPNSLRFLCGWHMC